MLYFIVPFKSVKASLSWVDVCGLLQSTLISICQQTSTDFRVIVVCTELPMIDYHHSSIDFLQVETDLTVINRRQDKLNKIKAGFEFAKRYNPSHYMVVDSDDLISNKIVEFVSQNIEHEGWIFNHGYVHEVAQNYFYVVRSGFYNHCGTCAILKGHLLEMLFLDKRGWFDHEIKTFKALKIELPFLPFVGTIYSSQNGQNNYANHPLYKRFWFQAKPRFNNLIRFKQITPEIKSEFMIL